MFGLNPSQLGLLRKWTVCNFAFLFNEICFFLPKKHKKKLVNSKYLLISYSIFFKIVTLEFFLHELATYAAQFTSIAVGCYGPTTSENSLETS